MKSLPLICRRCAGFIMTLAILLACMPFPAAMAEESIYMKVGETRTLVLSNTGLASVTSGTWTSNNSGVVQIVSSNAASCKVRAVSCESASSALITCHYKYMLAGGVFNSYSYFRVYVSPSSSGSTGGSGGSGGDDIYSPNDPWDYAGTTSGRCGASAWYQFYDNGETLCIYGSGHTWGYGGNDLHRPGGPWSSRLNTVEIDYGIRSLGSYMFQNFNIQKITIPYSVTTLVKYCFANTSGNCKPFNNVDFVLPAQISSVQHYCFVGNYFKSFTIPSNSELKHIWFSTFYNCPQLEKVVLNPKCEKIWDKAFAKCPKLTSILIPPSVTEIVDDAFDECSPDLTFLVEKGSYAHQFAIEHNIKVEFLESVNTLRESADLVLPESLTMIYAEAFEGVSASKVFVPEQVTTISDRAFADCSKLTQIYIPSGVTHFGTDIFGDAEELTIYGHSGSLAETYASENGFTFLSVMP